MPSIESVLQEMRDNPRDVRFEDALRVAAHYFGKPRTRGSHHFFRMPWSGDPLVNLQQQGRTAKAYQVRQLLRAVDRLEHERDERR